MGERAGLYILSLGLELVWQNILWVDTSLNIRSKMLNRENIIDKLKTVFFVLLILGTPLALTVLSISEGGSGGVTEDYWRGAD